MEPHPAPGCAQGAAGAGAPRGMRALPGDMDPSPSWRGCRSSMERGWTPGAVRVFPGEAGAPRGGCGRSWALQRMEEPREGGERTAGSSHLCAAPKGWECPKHLSLGVGSGSPGGVGLGAQVWAEMMLECLPPQTSLCCPSRALSRREGRAPRAGWSGTGCLTCTAHAEAPLLFASLLLQPLSFSQGWCCSQLGIPLVPPAVTSAGTPGGL